MAELPHALIVAGPTCSGKSALALELAQALGGVVVNADSMQVYCELRVLTARPSIADEATAPHFLYGVRAAAESGSVGWWRAAALREMAAAHEAGELPILCGGTGLYFLSLTRGLADIPPIDEAVRDEARALLAEVGAAALHARLLAADPATAARLLPHDSQRIARAWEVWRGTGQGLAAWQARPGQPASWRFSAVLLDPPRESLRAAIAGRFAAMLAAGALDELKALLALRLDPTLPLMRAHGVQELAAYLRGDVALEQAAARATLATSQYTKRQATWFHGHELTDPNRTHTIHARFADRAQYSEREFHDLLRFLTTAVDAG